MNLLRPTEPTSTDVAAARTSGIVAAITPDNEYFRLTKTLTYSFLFVLPLLCLYEVGILLVNPSTDNQVRISTDILLKNVLSSIGLGGLFWLTIVVLAIGGVIVLREPRKDIPIRPRYFGFMLLESTIYAVAAAFIVGTFVQQIFSLQWPALQNGGAITTPQTLVLSLGAGLYEELIFRLILVNGLAWILMLTTRLTPWRRYLVAACIGAAIFSAVHHIGAYGDPFTLRTFSFRFLLGLVLNFLLVWRGFGVAAMTHAIYDVFVTLIKG